MNEKRFEDDGVEYNNNYNYALLDTYYEFDGKMIIEWNKHSDNVEYTDFERITEILNIKQMRLESLMKHREEIGKLFDRIDEQQATIERLEEENDNCKNDYRELFSNYVALEEKNEQLRKENEVWQKENKELNSIKKFAEKNGINIFLINEAFRKCWKDNGKLFEENERLRNQLERKTILLKIRTKHIDDREKSFHELLNYLESFCYKSNIDGNYAKQDIINILNNWEIREYD